LTEVRFRALNRAIKDNKLLPEDEDFRRQRDPWNKQGTEIWKNR